MIILASQYDVPSRSQTPEPLLPQTDEPDALDPDNLPTINFNDSDDSSTVEIIDSGSDTDICEEIELMKFSRIFCDVQKNALAEEKAKGNKQKSYQGLSRTTTYHRNNHRRDLAAQNYLPVHEYMEQMEAQKNEEKLTTPQDLTFEEEEESSDDDAATVSRL
jgi:hypothetical protein